MVVPVDAKEEMATVIKVTDEVSEDRGLEVQVSINMERGGEEVAQVIHKGEEIIAQARVQKSPSSLE